MAIRMDVSTVKEVEMRRMLMIIVVLALAAVGPNPVANGGHCMGALRVIAAEQSAAQQNPPPMPPPGGNKDHSAPAPGAYCSREKHEARNCQCHAKCIHDENGKLVEIEEDGVNCRANCYKKHCHCPADCE